MTRRHPAAVWPDPLERRQLWALDRDAPQDAPLVRILRGEAEAMRPGCRAGRLICPIPDCPDRRLTARGGRLRHDHFAHRSGGGHGPETIAHWAAKHLVGLWLRRQPGLTEVDVDSASIETGQRPDILGRLPDGRRLAIEVQYAALAERSWRARHDRYAAAGYIDVWLWGRSHRWLTPTGDPDRFRLPGLLAVLNEEQLPVRWIDPAGPSLFAPRLDGEDELPEPFALWEANLFRARIDDGAIVAPFDDAEAALREERLRQESADAERAADRARRVAEQGAARAAHRAELERRQRESAERERLAREAERRRHEYAVGEQIRDAWRLYYARNVGWIAKAWNAIRTQTEVDHLLPIVPGHWHALAFERYIVERVGETVDVDDLVDLLGRLVDVPADVRTEVAVAFVGVLVRAGYLGAESGTRASKAFRILADAADDAVPLAVDRPDAPKRGTDPSADQLALFDS